MPANIVCHRERCAACAFYGSASAFAHASDAEIEIGLPAVQLTFRIMEIKLNFRCCLLMMSDDVR